MCQNIIGAELANGVCGQDSELWVERVGVDRGNTMHKSQSTRLINQLDELECPSHTSGIAESDC
jgi:hypothetical protein